MGRPESVEEYLALIPEESRELLESLRRTIRSVVPDATEIISYGMPAFRLGGRTVVSYAAFKDHCSLFPMSVAVIDAFRDDVDRFRTSTGTLQFTADRPLPKSLVRKIVKARVAENASRKK